MELEQVEIRYISFHLGNYMAILCICYVSICVYAVYAVHSAIAKYFYFFAFLTFILAKLLRWKKSLHERRRKKGTAGTSIATQNSKPLETSLSTPAKYVRRTAKHKRRAIDTFIPKRSFSNIHIRLTNKKRRITGVRALGKNAFFSSGWQTEIGIKVFAALAPTKPAASLSVCQSVGRMILKGQQQSFKSKENTPRFPPFKGGEETWLAIYLVCVW